MSDNYTLIVRFFQDGGMFIFPIGIVLAVGVVICIERWLFLTREKYRNSKAFNDFLPLLRTTDIERMQQFSRENTAPITRIIGCGIDMMKVSKQRGDIENSMSEGMLETVPRLEQRTGYLAVLANVATLLGLLGTIIGLISAFTAVANANPAEKSQLLSQSISVAMNTTAFGLMAAIPLLVMHAVLRNKTQKITNSIEMAAVKFLNIMTVNRLIESASPREIALTAPVGSPIVPSQTVAPTVETPNVESVATAAPIAVAQAPVAPANVSPEPVEPASTASIAEQLIAGEPQPAESIVSNSSDNTDNNSAPQGVVQGA